MGELNWRTVWVLPPSHDLERVAATLAASRFSNGACYRSRAGLVLLGRQVPHCSAKHAMEPTVGNAPTSLVYETSASLATLGWQSGAPGRIRTYTIERQALDLVRLLVPPRARDGATGGIRTRTIGVLNAARLPVTSQWRRWLCGVVSNHITPAYRLLSDFTAPIHHRSTIRTMVPLTGFAPVRRSAAS